MPTTNADNLSTVGMRPSSVAGELVVFMTKSKVETMLWKEESVSLIYLDLKPRYSVEVTTSRI